MRQAVIFNPKTTLPVEMVSDLGPQIRDALSPTAKVKLFRGFRSGQIALTRTLAYRDRSNVLVGYIGHGHENSWVGEYRYVTMLDPFQALPNELVTAGFNDRLLSGTIAVSIACDTGQRLAESAIARGCRAYIGCQSDVYVGEPHTEFPYDAAIRGTFLTFFTTLAAGGTAGEALAAFEASCDALIDRLNSSNLKAGPYYADCVEQNRDFFMVWGDPDARWTE